MTTTKSRSDRKVVRRTNADFPAPTPQPTPCRLFQGRATADGYGRHWIRGEGRHELLHRWVWQQVHGPIPDEMCVLHKCDQPLCYRLDHLFLGTQADNMADMGIKGRHGMSKLTEESVRWIRSLYATGNYSTRNLGEMFDVHNTTILRAIKRQTTTDIPTRRT